MDHSKIQIITAASILGLKPTGVEKLPDALLKNGLSEKLNAANSVIHIPTYNQSYSYQRDAQTLLLNEAPLREFLLSLQDVIKKNITDLKFPLVLGGDCSILIGIISALKAKGTFGLFFMDAHADFYEPEKSTTGEVADMDLAIVTGRGPEILSNINQASPYVREEHIIHIGQRDMEETKKYGSQDIRDTRIKCIDFPYIQINGVEKTVNVIEEYVRDLRTDGFWIHFDTDVLADEINPAVDYRLPGGLSFKQCEKIVKHLSNKCQIIGMSVSIFNPNLDSDGKIAAQLTECIGSMFK